MGEVALTKAYVFQKDDGAYEAYNCTVEETDGGLVITPAEDVVSNVSVQVNQDTNVTVKFYNGDLSTTVSAGLPQWVSTEENAADFENGDKDSSLSSLTVSNGELSRPSRRMCWNTPWTSAHRRARWTSPRRRTANTRSSMSTAPASFRARATP